ncbi:MAG TPA: PAS domain S-box protein [Candidatus Sulfotelmatobacter sp.]|nr:PAS domain S-box protein [Candidatus Sulfotelmatobacter sp.]
MFGGSQFSDAIDAVSASSQSLVKPFAMMEFQTQDQAEAVLRELAEVFSEREGLEQLLDSAAAHASDEATEEHPPNLEAKYRALLEQIPAVVFMAYLDRAIGEAYVSPEIEAALGYSREEWLEDPVRWYERIHPDDKHRWSTEAAEMFLTGRPLRSAYRVLSRDGRVVWFRCDARMMRREDGRPWFIHGVAFDISDLKRTEKQFQAERNLASAILETVDALVLVMDREGRIIRFNRTCEQTTGYSFAEVQGKPIWEVLQTAEGIDRFRAVIRALETGNARDAHFESHWITRDGIARLIAWTTTILPASGDAPTYIVASGMDITERKHLEKTILDISAREQRRIGQDLHDGLGQHLTGIAFMAKVQEQKLAEKNLSEAVEAAKIVRLVNDAISHARELAKGLAPVVSDAHGLMSALQLHAAEVEDLFRVSCRFQCGPPVLVSDRNVATHLFHIAQEAITNAIKHGQARKILVRLSDFDGRGTLVISDDGKGLVMPAANHGGMGLQIMKYRADMIGGTLEIHCIRKKGTTISCRFPMNDVK